VPRAELPVFPEFHFIYLFSFFPTAPPSTLPVGRLLVVVEVVVVVALAGQVVVAFDDFGRRGPKTLAAPFHCRQRPHCTRSQTGFAKLN